MKTEIASHVREAFTLEDAVKLVILKEKGGFDESVEDDMEDGGIIAYSPATTPSMTSPICSTPE